MKTARSKDKWGRESALTQVQRAILDAATHEQLLAIRASINARLRTVKGGGRPRKKNS